MEFNKVFKAFNLIGATQGTNAKIAIFDEIWNECRDTVSALLKATYDPYVNYYISVDPTQLKGCSTEEMTDEQLEVVWSHLEKALQLLNTRALSGNRAKEQVAGFFSMLSPEAAKYFGGVLNRDLKLGGINITTFKRYIPSLAPSISPALCKDVKDGKTQFSFPTIVEPKWDGVRALIFVNDQGIPTALSRNGLGFNNWGHICDAIIASGLKSVVLDGEFLADDFSQTTSITSTHGKHGNAHTLKYYVFDAMTRQEWDTKTTKPIEERKVYVDQIISLVGLPLVKTEWVVVDALEDLMIAFDDFQARLKAEGLVAKKPKGKYTFKRSTDWIKLKPDTTVDLSIVGAEIGKPDGKFSKSLGALVLEGEVEWEGKTYNVRVNVGSGLTEADSIDLWRMHLEGNLIGKTAEIKFDRVCQNEKGEYSLRFPRFLRMRFDK